jgi:hypothetical protein
MQAALAAAVLALRTPGDARNGGPPSPSGYV